MFGIMAPLSRSSFCCLCLYVFSQQQKGNCDGALQCWMSGGDAPCEFSDTAAHLHLCKWPLKGRCSSGKVFWGRLPRSDPAENVKVWNSACRTGVTVFQFYVRGKVRKQTVAAHLAIGGENLQYYTPSMNLTQLDFTIEARCMPYGPDTIRNNLFLFKFTQICFLWITLTVWVSVPGVRWHVNDLCLETQLESCRTVMESQTCGSGTSHLDCSVITLRTSLVAL